jgi:hypothetical protein
LSPACSSTSPSRTNIRSCTTVPTPGVEPKILERDNPRAPPTPTPPRGKSFGNDGPT